MAYSQVSAGAGYSAQDVVPRESESIDNRLAELFVNLKGSVESLHQTRSRLFGEPPPNEGKSGPSPVPAGQFGIIHDRISGLEALANEFNNLANSLTRA